MYDFFASIMETIYEILKFKTERDEDFLIKKGLQEAKRKNLDILIGDKTLSVKNPEGFISLLGSQEKIIAVNLISLIAEQYAQVTERYLENKEFLQKYYP